MSFFNSDCSFCIASSKSAILCIVFLYISKVLLSFHKKYNKIAPTTPYSSKVFSIISPNP
nr:MAG TPA: hypothetical protein [Caudoviricetes sp.]